MNVSAWKYQASLRVQQNLKLLLSPNNFLVVTIADQHTGSVSCPKTEELYQEEKESPNDPFALTDEWQISDKWTPLHVAAERLDINQIRSILTKSDYDINATTRETHETPLHKAITSGEGDRVGIIQLLVSHGADPNPRDCVCNTPMHYAAKGGLIDAVRTLIELGATVDVDNREPEREHDDGCGCGNQHASLAGLLSGLTGGQFKSGPIRKCAHPRVQNRRKALADQSLQRRQLIARQAHGAVQHDDERADAEYWVYNEDRKKNILYEVTEKGNGSWASGMRIVGDDKDRAKKRISEFGRAKNRTGLPGQKPVVWLWVTKEGK
ncbi:ankyrin repeat-containing domain protein [Rhexocercosporidium sp. MPI-PUGE-AT-0058]|nr:ankyrin repeat-containing domain protein [Rhexocercosporidium sp. MPI-PUGE-AT-0058]